MKNQLFVVIPDKKIIIKILKLYGINGFEDTHFFTKDDLINLNTVELLNKYNDELKKYYLPCKFNIYFKDITLKRSITILRQLLKLYDYTLYSKEKYIKSKKKLIYKIMPIDKHIETKNKQKKKIILQFE